jgi:hypothetical protein
MSFVEKPTRQILACVIDSENWISIFRITLLPIEYSHAYDAQRAAHTVATP